MNETEKYGHGMRQRRDKVFRIWALKENQSNLGGCSEECTHDNLSIIRLDGICLSSYYWSETKGAKFEAIDTFASLSKGSSPM